VVASILVAFALDAWWDARTGRADLRLELDGVARELADNRDALDERLVGHVAKARAIEEVLDRISQRSGSSSIELPDSLIYLVAVTSPTTDPSAGALDGLISSGRISLIGDLELRRFLASFRTRIDDLREDELGARAVAHQGVFSEMAGSAAAEAGARVAVTLGPDEVFPTSTSSLSLDGPGWQRLRSQLALRRFWFSAAVREGEELLEAMDAALERIEAEIDGL
jgi:hypothetical protein